MACFRLAEEDCRVMSVPTHVMPPHTLDLMKSWVGIDCGERRVSCVMMNVIVQGTMI